LKLYTSNRLEILAEKLAGLLRKPLPSPMQKEIILVQSKGMERWLCMELARYHGICANCRFPFPNRFVFEVFREVIPDIPEDSPFDPAVMAWKVMKLLPSCLEKRAFKNLKFYLEEDRAGLKLFQLSFRIADLFDQYLTFRPEMILDWEKEKGLHSQDWQAILWRELVNGNERVHRAALLRAFLEGIRKPSARLENLPERIAVFGISALPPFHIQVLAEVSRFIGVHLFLMNPCQEYWADIVSGREMMNVVEQSKKAGAPEDLHLERGNSLLASTGMLGRDFLKMITDLGPEEYTFFADPGEATLLSAIQADILNLRDRGREGNEKEKISEADRSIRVHSCHSPMREVEVLQDGLLSLFAGDPALLPKDILVMTPDIETYAPFIQAVFSLPPGDPRFIPFSIADRGVRKESQMLDAFLSLLDLPGSRFGATQVLGILESRAVRSRFSLAEADLELVERWVGETRIRWGIDGESRKELGLPEFSENTWRAGLERMLLGYALPGRDELFRGILPYDRIEGDEAEVLGNFLGFMEKLYASSGELTQSRTLKYWSEFLLRLFETFFLPDAETEREAQVIRRVLNDLASKQALAGFDEKVGLDVIKSYLRSFLETEGFGLGFLTGGLTFCAMLPMRSIPFKVICLLGMSDEAYPRRTKPIGFDLIAREPRAGDRSRRKDDRYLFLEALLSARQRLYISYVGQSVQDNSLRPPSVLVSELLDYVEQGFEMPGKNILEQVVFRHRLQAFSPEYFQKDEKLFSYSEENFEAARRAADVPIELEPFITTGLPEPGEEAKKIELGQLCRFFANPARFVINQRLNIYLEEEAGVLDEREPFQLSGLEKYQLEQDLFGRALEKGSLQDFFPVIRASGQLPPGTPGELLYGQSRAGVEAFLRDLLAFTQGKMLEPLEVDLRIGGFQIGGRLENIYAAGLLRFRYADVKPRDRLTLWLHHLVLNMIGAKGYPASSLLIGKDLQCVYPPVSESEKILQNLLKIYWEAMSKPLHFFPASSWVYAEALAKDEDEERAMRVARKEWLGDDYSHGESEDPYLQTCFKNIDPLDEEFENLSQEIFGPIVKCEEQTKRE
jgi:exodeoxyribonuclease V gamma subunit